MNKSLFLITYEKALRYYIIACTEPNHTLTEQYGYAAPAHKKYNPKTSTMVALGFGKRSVNDDADEGKMLIATASV